MKSPRPGISPILVLLAALLFSAGVVVDLVTADEHSHNVSDFIQICRQSLVSWRILSMNFQPQDTSPPFSIRHQMEPQPGRTMPFLNTFFFSTSLLGCWTPHPPRSSSITLPTLAHFTFPPFFSFAWLVLSKGGCHCLGEYSWAL